MLQCLEGADGHAKLFTRLGIFNGFLQQTVHGTNCFRTHGKSCTVNGGFQRRQCRTLCAQQLRCSHLDIFQMDFCCTMTINVGVLALADASCSRINNEYRNTVTVELAAGGAGNDQQFVGCGSIQHLDLGAIKHIVIAIFCGGGCNCRQIVTAVCLCIGCCELQAAFHDGANQRLFLLGTAKVSNQATADDTSRDEGLDDHAFAKLFHHHHQINRRATETAILFLEWHGQPAELGKQIPGFITEPFFTFQILATRIEVVLAHYEFLHAVLQHLLLITVRKIH